ncbi:Hydrolase, putative isoform 2 [Hibiscus syriacus]|uniref:Hydrolase, putative isoform 2 n=1 Tax=Hibiscus syriacus TaxID=106335 RepID=A0A6A2Y7N5_HIBSY|nr:Hydrolase, putative isoform 2 [Hibiscus syriacus]
MALLSFPSSPFHFFSPRSIPRRPSFVCSSSATNGRSRSAILWFKHDLRLNDHPGLTAAARTHRFLLPLYVFDHRILSRYSDDMLELLLFALEDLRNSLKEQGSNLMVRFGSAENIIKDLVKELRTCLLKKKLIMNRLPASYNDFKKLKLLPTSPPLPGTLPVAETELDWGPLPTFSDLRDFIEERIGKSKVSWNLMKGKPAEVILKENFSKSSGTKPKSLNVESNERRRLDKSVFVTRKDTWKEQHEMTGNEVHERLRNAETREGASFTSLFGPSLCLASVAAAADAVCSMEWFSLLALKSQLIVGHEGPAILLVHGFGAFLEHYRDNINGITERGNRVWAITLLGFGKSEKPNVVYTELLWAELLRDFIIEVVGEPVHQVGNSIGGYFVSIVAGLWPALVKQALAAAGLVAQLLLFYLRLNIRNTVKSFYPTKTDRADNWLINEMLRASNDPGVIVVLESIFTFDLSIPLNYLLEGYEERVLILQGMKDPPSDSKAKLTMLKEHCTGLVIKELDAGHCPHDE